MTTHFDFELILDSDPDVDGFSQGHVTVTVNGVTASTKERPSSVMIFITLTNYLQGVLLVATGANKVATLFGVDTNFDIVVAKEKNARVRIAHGRKLLGVVPAPELTNALWQATERFARIPAVDTDLKASRDSSTKDLVDAMNQFRRALVTATG